jgi:hypothetical protein
VDLDPDPDVPDAPSGTIEGDGDPTDIDQITHWVWFYLGLLST